MTIRQINHPFAFIAVIVITLMSSCIPQEKITYFQPESDTTDTENKLITTSYEATIQKGDVLSIKVSSLSPEASSFFNPYEDRMGRVGDAELTSEGYMVDAQGNVEIPLLGTVHLEGLTIQETKDTLRKQLLNYLKNPTVRVRFKNFRITVLGEVGQPSVYNIPNEKITLPEALGLAGDLTIYGRRDNILIIREKDNNREFARVDLNHRDLFASDYYYLQSNDIIYVEPTRSRKASADNFFKIAPIVISSLTMLTLFLVRFPQ